MPPRFCIKCLPRAIFDLYQNLNLRNSTILCFINDVGQRPNSAEPGGVVGGGAAALCVIHRPFQHLHGEVSGLNYSGGCLCVFIGAGQTFLWPGLLRNQRFIVDFQLVEINFGESEVLRPVLAVQFDLVVIRVGKLLQGNMVLFLQLAVEFVCIAAVEIDESGLRGVLLHPAQVASGRPSGAPCFWDSPPPGRG